MKTQPSARHEHVMLQGLIQLWRQEATERKSDANALRKCADQLQARLSMGRKWR